MIKTIKKLNQRYSYSNKLHIQWGDPLDHLYRYTTFLKDLAINISVKANGSIAASPYIPITIGNVKNHTFTEYWENGLSRLWNIGLLQDAAKQITSVETMGKNIAGIEQTWIDKDINLDLIDDGLLENN